MNIMSHPIIQFELEYGSNDYYSVLYGTHERKMYQNSTINGSVVHTYVNTFISRNIRRICNSAQIGFFFYSISILEQKVIKLNERFFRPTPPFKTVRDGMFYITRDKNV